MSSCDSLKLITDAYIASCLQQYGSQSAAVTTGNNGKKAAVLVPFFQRGEEWHILYTRRSEAVNDHKGQVSFPGGAIESGDKNPSAAAMREAYEEIGLEPKAIQILGAMEEFQTVTNFIVQPIVARIEEPHGYRINPGEVARVFSIPLQWLCDPENFYTREWLNPAGNFRPVFYFKPYDGETLWGISAIITVQLMNILGLTHKEIPNYL